MSSQVKADPGSRTEGKKPWQDIAALFFPLSILALALGLKDVPFEKISYEQYLFAGFFILFRSKIFLDDLWRIDQAQRLDVWFQLNFFAGVFLWFIWLLAGVYASNLDSSISLIGVFLIAATALLIIEILLGRFVASRPWRDFKCQGAWLYFNLFYGCFVALYFLGESKTYLMKLLIITCIMDILISRRSEKEHASILG